MNLQTVPFVTLEAPPLQGGGNGRVVAVLTTHNRLGPLRRTMVRMLRSLGQHLAAIVVVDNASDDGTAAWLAALSDPRVYVVTLARNMGGAGGFAAGLDVARRQFDPDWYLVMDDDARPMPGALAAFHASDVSVWDAVASAVYDPAGGICDINRPTHDPFASWVKFLRTLRAGREGFHLGPRDYAGTHPVAVDGASFVGLFLSRRALDLAGLPDEKLFIYGDDALQTLRLSRAGGRIGFLPHLRFEHDVPTPISAQNVKPLWKVYYQHRNALILYRYAAGWMFWPICLIVIPRWALRARAYPSARAGFLRLFCRGVWHGLLRKTTTPHETVLGWATPRR